MDLQMLVAIAWFVIDCLQVSFIIFNASNFTRYLCLHCLYRFDCNALHFLFEVNIQLPFASYHSMNHFSVIQDVLWWVYISFVIVDRAFHLTSQFECLWKFSLQVSSVIQCITRFLHACRVLSSTGRQHMSCCSLHEMGPCSMFYQEKWEARSFSNGSCNQPLYRFSSFFLCISMV